MSGNLHFIIVTVIFVFISLFYFTLKSSGRQKSITVVKHFPQDAVYETCLQQGHY